MPKRSNRLDLNELAKSIVDQATGSLPPTAKKNAAAMALGKLGGEARAAKLSKEQLLESARKANAGRWPKKQVSSDVETSPKPQPRRGVIRPR